MEKKTRKSVPRPGSGRRGSDGAVGLVQVGVRLTPDQHAWVREHGNAGLRQLIQDRIESERRQKLFADHGVTMTMEELIKTRIDHPGWKTDFGHVTEIQKQIWRKECEKHGIPIPDEWKEKAGQ